MAAEEIIIKTCEVDTGKIEFGDINAGVLFAKKFSHEPGCWTNWFRYVIKVSGRVYYADFTPGKQPESIKIDPYFGFCTHDTLKKWTGGIANVDEQARKDIQSQCAHFVGLIDEWLEIKRDLARG